MRCYGDGIYPKRVCSFSLVVLVYALGPSSFLLPWAGSSDPVPFPSLPFPAQEQFKTGLMNASEELKKEAAKAVEEFTTKGPFTSDKSPKEALASIAEFRAMLNALKEQEETIRKGLGMFKIDQPLSKDLQFMEKVSGLLPPHPPPPHPLFMYMVHRAVTEAVGNNTNMSSRCCHEEIRQ